MRFSKTLYPLLQKAACGSCHNPDGVAAATRLHFPDVEATPNRIEAFGKSLVALVNREQPEQSLLLRKPTNRIAHVGGERIAPGSREEIVLKAWILDLAKMNGEELASALRYREALRAGAASGPSGPVLRRQAASIPELSGHQLLHQRRRTPIQQSGARGGTFHGKGTVTFSRRGHGRAISTTLRAASPPRIRSTVSAKLPWPRTSPRTGTR